MSLSTRFPLKRVFITGAGSGLGRALALRFARAGWTVGVSDVQATTAEETLQQVVAAGGKGEAYTLDVTDPQAFSSIAERFLALHGGVDVVINNAGVAVAGVFEEIPLKDWDWIVNINLKGVIHGCRAFLPQLKRQKAGHIINVASVAGLIAAPEMAPYHATKYAVVGLTESLRGELKPFQIDASVVCPYFFQTNILNSARSNRMEGASFVSLMMQRSSAQAEQVAETIFREAGKRRCHILPHREARTMWFFKRLSNTLWFFMTDRSYQAQKQREKRGG